MRRNPENFRHRARKWGTAAKSGRCPVAGFDGGRALPAAPAVRWPTALVRITDQVAHGTFDAVRRLGPDGPRDVTTTPV
jgi:DNA-binding LacI/PurR family transcriptional regulator